MKMKEKKEGKKEVIKMEGKKERKKSDRNGRKEGKGGEKQ